MCNFLEFAKLELNQKIWKTNQGQRAGFNARPASTVQRGLLLQYHVAHCHIGLNRLVGHDHAGFQRWAERSRRASCARRVLHSHGGDAQ
jgi:hypothetical protein